MIRIIIKGTLIAMGIMLIPAVFGLLGAIL